MPFGYIFTHFASEHAQHDPLQYMSVVLDDTTLITLISNALNQTATSIVLQIRDLGIRFNPDIQFDNDRSALLLSIEWSPTLLSNGHHISVPLEQVPGIPAVLTNINPSSFRPQQLRRSLIEFISRLFTRFSRVSIH